MSNLLVSNLKKIFPTEEYGVILRAMRHDPVVWGALQDPTITNKMVDLAGSEISRWTPAFLALITLGIPNKYQTLRTQPVSVDEKVKYRAAAELEKITSQQGYNPKDISIEVIGMASLALRERWIILNQADISIFKEQANQAVWKAITACLIGILPDPGELLRDLLTSSSPQLQSMAIHAVSANPDQGNQLATKFLSAIALLPTIERIEILRQCSQVNSKLAEFLATNLIDQFSTASKEADNPFEIIQDFAELSELFRITGQYEQAIPTLEKLWQATSSLQTDLTAQLAQAAAKANKQDAAIKAIEKISQLEDHLQPDDRANVALAQIHTGQLDPIFLENSDTPGTLSQTNPTTLVAKAQVALKGANFVEAQNFATRAYEITSQFLKSQDTFSGAISAAINPDFIQGLIELLIELELVIEAGNLCQLSLSKLPNNDEIVFLNSKAAYLSGDLSQAQENAQIAVALAPSNSAYRKSLIDLLMRQSSWKEALHETETYITQLNQPAVKDYQLLATCYLNNDQLNDAVLAAKKGLAIGSEDGELHALLGEVYKRDQKAAEAIKHLNKAILLSPQTPEYWSNLAELYSSEANTEKAEEILLSAFEVIPSNPLLHLQLGLLHSQNNKPGEALGEFHKAKQHIAPETAHSTRQEIYHRLGEALHMQGYHQEAENILEEGHQAFPVDPGIAHLYGKALFHNGRVQEALSAYQIASQGGNPPAEVLLDHSKALLTMSGKTAEALAKIQRAIETDPNNPVGTALLAEATAQSGEHTNAIKIYQKALLTDLADQPEWQVSLSTKLAKSAFALNQPEVAVTFLQETLQKVPENLAVKQTLCDAYIQTKLTKDALRLIDDILEKHSQNLEILMWSADQAIAINDLEFAAEILHQAREISPHKADVLVRLGYIQLENGEEEQARKTFGQLFSADNVDVKNLRLAAQALIGLGDITSSIPYLEKALELSDYKSSDLLKELTKLHIQSGDFEAALETVQKQIKIQPMLPNLYVTQADIYFQLSQQKAALNSMLKALELSPDSASLHAKTAYLLRKNQDLAGSLYHIKQAFDIDGANTKIRLQAGQILSACLLNAEALEVVAPFIEMEKPPLAAALLTAELLLEQPSGQRFEQAELMLARAAELAGSHPGLLALKSKTALLNGEREKAEDLFEQAMLNLAAFEGEELDSIALSSINLTIAGTALALQRWDVALFFAREAQQLTLHEPAPYFLQAATYTLRAEAHFHSEALNKSNQEGKIVATHKVSQGAFQSAVKSAEAYSPNTDAIDQINRWRARGDLALLNGDPIKHKDILSQTPQDFSVLLAAFRRADLLPDIDITLFHDEPDVIFERALLNANQNPESALGLAEQLVQTSPHNPDYAALYSLLAQKAGQTRLALNSIELALSFCPEEAQWHAMAGDLHLTLADPENAITHLEKALALQKDNPQHLYQLGKAYNAGHSPGNAIRVLEQATTINPLEPDYWMLLASCYQKTGNLNYALESVKQALKLAPNNLSNLINATEIAQQMEDKQVPVQLINKAVTLPTQNIDEIIKITNLLISLERIEDASSYLDEKINLSVDQVALQIQRAKIIGLSQGNKQKLELLIQMAKENPKNPLIFAHLADAYIEAKNPDEAIRSAQFALKYADDSLDINLKTKLHYQLGVLLRQAGQLDQALHQLTQSLQLSPNFLSARLEIGETLCQRKEFVQALEHYQKAIEIAPRDPRPYKEAGLLLKESKDYVGAEAMFRQAYSLDSNDIFTQRQLATVIALALIHQPNTNRFSHGKSKNQ